MQDNNRPIVWLLALLLLATLLMPIVGRAPKPRPAGWEYKIADIDDLAFDTQMATLGTDHWELVSARRASSGGTGSDSKFGYECIFKRPKE